MDGQLSQILRDGLAHHQAGRFAEAEAAYRRVLQQQPSNPDALHLLGLIAQQVGQLEASVQLIQQSVQQVAHFASVNNLGESYRRLGRLDEAARCFRKSIEMQPRNPDALHNLGLVLQQWGKSDEAIACWEKCVAIDPKRFVTLVTLGRTLLAQGHSLRAIIELKRALEINDRSPELHSMLGLAYSEARKFDEAIAHARRSVELAPQVADAHNNLGVILDRARRHEEALECYRSALKLDSRTRLWGNLGAALDQLDRIEEAFDAFSKAASFDDAPVEVVNSLSAVARKLNRVDIAIDAAERAVRMSPSNADAHANLAFSLLLAGDLSRGFREYEWRWNCSEFTSRPRQFQVPLWDGSDPRGRRILVHAEQGFGDMFQFIRYATLLSERGAEVIVECHVAVRELVESVRGVTKAVPLGMILPEFDLHCPLMTLPRAFGTTLDSIPADVPYIRPDPTRVANWEARIEQQHPGKFKVGIAWAGAGGHINDRNRSMHLATLLPLNDVPNVQLLALQVGAPAVQIQELKDRMNVQDLSAELTSFAETAAVIANLDLVLTVDTSVAHLAGAMGRKVWTMLPMAPDWRWLLDRETSPWYPSMRLYRQSSRKDWSTVVERVVSDLRGAATGNLSDAATVDHT